MKNSIYNIGLAERDVTPPVGILTAGFVALTEPSTHIELPLKVFVAHCEDSQGKAFLLFSIEWLGFYEKSPYVREKISKATGIAEERIALVATHTHAGPRVQDMYARIMGPGDRPYLDWAIQQMIEAASEAMSKKVPSTIETYRSTFDLAINRRKLNARGRAEWAPNPEGPTDDRLYALAIRSVEDETLRGMVFSYACHPTSRRTLGIGGDFIGFAYKHLKTAWPEVKTGFLQGCCGEIKSNFVNEDGTNFRQASSEDIDEAGECLSRRLVSLIESGRGQRVAGDLCVLSHFVQLKRERPSEALHREFSKGTHYPMVEWTEKFPHAGIDKSEPPPIPMEVQLCSFGSSLALVFLAGETSVGYGIKIKKRFGEQYSEIIPVGYANEMIGYVVTADQIPQGGYEVWDAQLYYNWPGFLTEEAETDILDAVGSLMEENVLSRSG